jgi:hypothetical protein
MAENHERSSHVKRSSTCNAHCHARFNLKRATSEKTRPVCPLKAPNQLQWSNKHTTQGISQITEATVLGRSLPRPGMAYTSRRGQVHRPALHKCVFSYSIPLSLTPPCACPCCAQHLLSLSKALPPCSAATAQTPNAMLLPRGAGHMGTMNAKKAQPKTSSDLQGRGENLLACVVSP